VAISGRDGKKLDAAIEGTDIFKMECDAADREQVKHLYEWFEEEIGTLDILVYCAGVNIPKRNWSDTDPAEFERVVKINLTGAYNCMQPALKIMRERGEGQIFNVTSIAAIQTIPFAGVAYSASKHAQTNLGLFANLEAAPDGVRVTNVFPGETDTPLLDDRPEPPPAEKRAAMVHPEDVAHMVLAVAGLPKHVLVPELVVTPTYMPRT